MGGKKSPFNSYYIKRGQTRGAKVSFWAQLKAVIEVEAKKEKKEYLIRKKELIDQLIKSLKQLAINRKINDFDLNLEMLETMEGRQEMKQDLEQLGVNHLDVVRKLADIESDVILKRMLLRSEK